MKLVIISACFAITISLVFIQDAIGWRGIVPLRSTRAQVEQLVGVLNLRCQCYSTEAEIVRVKYASGPCKGDLAGWNVPADTVLSLEITPKNGLSFSEMNVRKEDFVRTVDDARLTHYGNGDKGLRYSVSPLGAIESIWYGPTVKDNHLRCAGFPFTDGGVTAYTPFYEFTYETVEDVTSRLGEFGVRLLKDSQHKGYVIVYGAQDKRKIDTVKKFVNTAKDYLIDEFDLDSNAFEVINGGYREKSTVEVFLIPREWPPPVATPTFRE